MLLFAVALLEVRTVHGREHTFNKILLEAKRKQEIRSSTQH